MYLDRAAAASGRRRPRGGQGGPELDPLRQQRRYGDDDGDVDRAPVVRAVDGLRLFYREAIALGLAAGESVVEFFRGEDLES